MAIDALTVTLFRADPDVIVGHEFLGVSLDVLLHRMRDLKVEHWSRIGRFRRVRWPTIARQGANIKFLNGRLLCDLASDVAKVCSILPFVVDTPNNVLRCLGHDFIDDVVNDGDVQDSSEKRAARY